MPTPLKARTTATTAPATGSSANKGRAADKSAPVEPAIDHKHGARASSHPLIASTATLERAAGFFRALGDPQRLRLLGHLLEREWCVTELAEAFDEGLSTISQRLRVLRAEGLVHRRRDGKHIYYTLADDHVRSLVESGLAHAAEPRSHGHDPHDLD